MNGIWGKTKKENEKNERVYDVKDVNELIESKGICFYM